jgi:hypothetical protein
MDWTNTVIYIIGWMQFTQYFHFELRLWRKYL